MMPLRSLMMQRRLTEMQRRLTEMYSRHNTSVAICTVIAAIGAAAVSAGVPIITDVSSTNERVDDLRTAFSNLEETAATKDDLSNFVTASDFDGLRALVADLNATIPRLNATVGGLDTRVGGLDTRVGGLDTRVGGLDTRVGGLDAAVLTLNALNDTVTDLNSKISTLETRIINLACAMATVHDNVNIRDPEACRPRP